MIKAMVDVVMNQSLLGVADRAFDGLQLLDYIQTAASLLEHADDALEVAFGPFEPLNYFRVGRVS
jgi:hypothetical protein